MELAADELPIKDFKGMLRFQVSFEIVRCISATQINIMPPVGNQPDC